jgi:type IV pilus assembly protein PilX
MLALRQQKQQGVVLIMVLLLLMVMTVLGVSGVGNSVLEEKMSSNYMQNYSAEQSAEFGTRVAGWWIDTNVNSLDDLNDFFRAGADGRQGLYSLQSAVAADAICQGAAGCSFDPRVSSHWCGAAEVGCPLQKGFVTLGTDDLETGTLPATETSPADLQPQFVVEYVGLTDTSGHATGAGGTDGYLSNGSGSGELHVFKVTAIGWGNSPTARNVIERNYHLSL